MDWNVVLSTGVGALIGSALTLIATVVAHNLERKKQKQEENRLIFGFLQSVHDEIETLWDTYIEKVGSHVEALQPGQPFEYYWPITQEYFTVYNNNAFLIGRIKDHDLRKLIVSTYSKARGLIDSYRLNNELVHKYEQAVLLHQETNQAVHASHVNARLQALVTYATSLKQSHMEVKSQVQELLRELRKKGVLSQNDEA